MKPTAIASAKTAMAKVLDSEIRTPQQTNAEELQNYELIGFGSGIYGGKHHKLLLDLADKFPQVKDKTAFIFSTSGAPVSLADEEKLDEYAEKSQSSLMEKLQSKGYKIIDEFICAGYNTNSFLRFFGGINKGRPNAEDLKHAEEFAQKLNRTYKRRKIALTDTEKTENWFSRGKAEADKGIPKNERIVGIGFFFLGSVLMVLYLAAHQILSTGFLLQNLA